MLGGLYHRPMKRLQIMLEDELYEALEHRAARMDVSKAAVVRQSLRAWLRQFPPLDSDPITAMIGADDVDPADVDNTVYR